MRNRSHEHFTVGCKGAERIGESIEISIGISLRSRSQSHREIHITKNHRPSARGSSVFPNFRFRESQFPRCPHQSSSGGRERLFLPGSGVLLYSCRFSSRLLALRYLGSGAIQLLPSCGNPVYCINSKHDKHTGPQNNNIRIDLHQNSKNNFNTEDHEFNPDLSTLGQLAGFLGRRCPIRSKQHPHSTNVGELRARVHRRAIRCAAARLWQKYSVEAAEMERN